VQVGVVCFILAYLITQRWEIFLGISDYVRLIEEYRIIYILMLITTIITIWTGVEYILVNKDKIQQALKK